MKEFKIDLSGYDGKVREVVSEAIQRHAFELGCRWVGVFEKRALHKDAPYLFTHKDGSLDMQMSGTVSWFNSHTNTLIYPADFLELTPKDVHDAPEDVKDAPKEPELKPFDRVLARDYDCNVWTAHLYSHRDENLAYIHQTVGDVGYHQCIPYEGNEHLLGTTGEPK